MKQYPCRVKRYCQCLEIPDDADNIRRYIECHAEDKHSKLIRDGIRSVGILEMDMYIRDGKVFMIVETGLDFDWDSAMAKLATLPGQAEWEKFVAPLQGCDENATSAQKWQLMERMFHLY